MRTSRTRRFKHAAGLIAVAMAASACAWQSGGTTAREDAQPVEYKAGMLGQKDGGTPVDGGTLTLAAYSETGLLDPAQGIVAGATGGVEMAAVFDVLMRWDPESGDVVPQLAQSLEASDDATEWTLELREDVTFSDGTPLNAEAVESSLERYIEVGGDGGELLKENIESIGTPDDLTVEFDLNVPWPSFDFMLTNGPGMIVAESSGTGDDFKPVGAGAFTLERYAQSEEMVLKARDDYWGGRPHLDSVRIVYVDDPNAAFSALGTGRLQAAFLRDPVVVRDALKAGYPGYLNMVSLGNAAAINSAAGHPGADPRVRKAMAYAIQPEVIYRRAYPGTGLADSALFPESSRWHTDAEPLPYDPDKARELLKAAKADGYDGKVTWLDGPDPASRTTALAAQSMLENVGFDVELDLVRSISDQISKVMVKKTYDVAGWGISWREAGPFARMYATLHAKGKATAGMATSEKMSALIEEIRGAPDVEAKRDVMERIQQQWNEDVPALNLGPQPELAAWTDRVRGVTGTVNSLILLDDAWLAETG